MVFQFCNASTWKAKVEDSESRTSRGYIQKLSQNQNQLTLDL